MPMPPPLLRGSYPLDPSNPSPYSCTIARPMGPRPREHRYNPFQNPFAVEASDKAVRDLFTMQRLVQRAVITFPSVEVVRLGKVIKHATAATINVAAFDPSVDPPAVIPPGVLVTLLEPLTTIILATGRNVYSFAGAPTFGVTFNVDIRGGEVVDLVVNNTDPSSTINGLQLRWQLFLYSDPEYSVEMARKGRPGPIA